MRLNLQQLFGNNSYQDTDYLYIKKQDLNIIASNSNRAEQLLVALLVNALSNFEGFLKTPDSQSILSPGGQTIDYSNLELFERLNLLRWNPLFRKVILIQGFVSRNKPLGWNIEDFE